MNRTPCPHCAAARTLLVTRLSSGAEARVCRACSRSWLVRPGGLVDQRIPAAVLDEVRLAAGSVQALLAMSQAERARRSSACHRIDCPRPLEGGDRAERAVDGLVETTGRAMADAIFNGELGDLLVAAVELDQVGHQGGSAPLVHLGAFLRALHSRLTARQRAADG